MSIIRVGLAETKNYSDGYDLIFGKKDDKAEDKKKEEDKKEESQDEAKKTQ